MAESTGMGTSKNLPLVPCRYGIWTLERHVGRCTEGPASTRKPVLFPGSCLGAHLPGRLSRNF